MKVTLITSTYNFPQSLRLCLDSILCQTVLPDEIVIADDGSTEETQNVVRAFCQKTTIPVKHVWQENHGFGKTKAMNKGFAVCTGDYIIQIDGDIIMERHFIEDHLRYARQGTFLCGSRSRIQKEYTERLFQGEKLSLGFCHAGLDDRLNALRCSLLTPFFMDYKHLRGCNMSFWRQDILDINGYDEIFNVYGYEDEDLQNRLERIGKKKVFIKFMCIEYHVYHPEHPTKRNLSDTRKIIDRNNDASLIRPEHGISDHIHEHNLIKYE